MEFLSLGLHIIADHVIIMCNRRRRRWWLPAYHHRMNASAQMMANDITNAITIQRELEKDKGDETTQSKRNCIFFFSFCLKIINFFLSPNTNDKSFCLFLVDLWRSFAFGWIWNWTNAMPPNQALVISFFVWMNGKALFEHRESVISRSAIMFACEVHSKLTQKQEKCIRKIL